MNLAEGLRRLSIALSVLYFVGATLIVAGVAIEEIGQAQVTRDVLAQSAARSESAAGVGTFRAIDEARKATPVNYWPAASRVGGTLVLFLAVYGVAYASWRGGVWVIAGFYTKRP